MEGEEQIPVKRGGRRKVKIEFIPDKSRRQITFSKRKAGLMKKAYELTTLTGTQALLLVASETGHVYTFATPKLQPFVTLPEGKNLIQSCLNAPEGVNEGAGEGVDMNQPGQGPHGHIPYESELGGQKPESYQPGSKSWNQNLYEF